MLNMLNLSLHMLISVMVTEKECNPKHKQLRGPFLKLLGDNNATECYDDMFHYIVPNSLQLVKLILEEEVKARP